MFFTKRRVRAALVAGAASAALLLTSCAGGGSGEDEAATDGPSFIYITSDPIGQNEFLKSGKVGIE